MKRRLLVCCSPGGARAQATGFTGRLLRSCWPQLALIVVVCLGRNALAADDAFFKTAKDVGQGLLVNLMWLSGMGAMLGFIMAGQAFSSGDVERGKTMLKGTVIGAVCIFGSVSLVQFIQQKFGDPKF